MTPLPGESGALWYDDEAGPMVRSYTVTRGRTRSADGAETLDVIALVRLADAPSGTPGDRRDPSAPDRGVPDALSPETPGTLSEEHLTLLHHCRGGPVTVAELAAGADLPLGVVRVLLGDLIDIGRIRVTGPVPPADLPDVSLLNHIISGLKSL